MKMKLYKWMFYSCLSLLLFSCKDEVSVPSMSYTADKLEITAGSAVTFTPAGSADYVTFWSGESLKNYYGLKSVTVAKASISFVSGVYKDISVTSNKSIFQVLISTNYVATHGLVANAINAIQTATWKDITASFADNTTASTTDGVPSGSLDVTSYANTPFYIAFKYKNDTIAKGATAYVKSFAVADSTKELGLISNFIQQDTVIVTGVGNTSWYSCLVSGGTTAKKWEKINHMAQVSGRANDPNEAWLVSPMINLSRGSADQGVAVKDITSLARSYSYVYNTPGTYKAVFVYTNSTMGASQQKTQEFTIVVK
jgi:Domain of unknown function (DUF5017)